MTTVQLISFFLNGFLLSRLLIKIQLPERFVGFIFEKHHYSFSKVLLILVFSSSLLSAFIPNMITVITLLPLVVALDKNIKPISNNPAASSTAMALAIIYGANIGGVGTIIGTPPNALLVGFMTTNAIPGLEHVSFYKWLLWGLPLILLLSFSAWLLLNVFFKPSKLVHSATRAEQLVTNSIHPLFRYGVSLGSIVFVLSTLLSIGLANFPELGITFVMLSLLLSLVFMVLLFVVKSNNGTPLLKIKDCYSDLPLKGIALASVAVVFSGILYALNLNEEIAKAIAFILPANIPNSLLFIGFSLSTIFVTEVMSNIATQFAMFIVVEPLSGLLGFPLYTAMITATLSCNTAFASPIATPVNGLAFGSLPATSLKQMILAGLLMNIIAGVIIGLYAYYIIPLI
mgnify:CR=1 FL=1